MAEQLRPRHRIDDLGHRPGTHQAVRHTQHGIGSTVAGRWRSATGLLARIVRIGPSAWPGLNTWREGTSVLGDSDFEVWYKADDFPVLNGRLTDRLTFSVDALAHALFVTGRAPGDTAGHGIASVYEWLHRVALIPAYVRRAKSGWLVRSDLARELDQSEKVALSYTLGQGLTGIFSTHVLSVRFLMHVDRYGRRHGLVADPRTKRRADFFGQLANGGWVVAEAKGRSTPINEELKRSMRAQKRTIRTIAGQRPEIEYGCAAYFEKSKNAYEPERMRLYAVDPEEEEPLTVNLRADKDSFILAYYGPFLAAIEAGAPTEAMEGYDTASFGPFGLTVGVLSTVVQRVTQARQGRTQGLYDDVMALIGPYTAWQNPGGQFADGTLVACKWQEALATEDWSYESEWSKW